MNIDMRGWLKQRFHGRLEEHGDEWAVPCPAGCDDGRSKEFRLWYNVERNLGTCYVCSRAYTPMVLLRTVDGLTSVQATLLLKDMTPGSGMSFEALRSRVEQFFYEDEDGVEAAPLVTMDLPEGFVSCRDTDRWPEYLSDRIPPDVARFHNVGWCTRGYYRDRLIVPVVLRKKRRFFIARDMTGKAEKKVLYPTGSPTSRTLFNYDVARKFSQVVLVESVFDAMHVGEQAMAIFGTSLSAAQLELLHRSNAREVVLVFDGDEAGRNGVTKVAERLRGSLPVRVVDLPDGKDPDDLPSRALWRRIRNASLASDLASHVRRALGRGVR